MSLDHETHKTHEKAQPGAGLSRDSIQRASVAQQLLVARLQARNRRDLSVDLLERGAHVLWVTCKNWFSSGQAPAVAPDDHNKDTDAHRDH
ncbi:MAG: hypothetical protein M3Q12_01230 [Pseudomonadota bacterium]|uniref:hypothetical protein n=1 Tax=Polaromonas sp. TaxID=1869339 RepID=UPI0017CC25D4|nr:hypothetical protein [Polaromonas sp.]MBA3594104.1 hypothetical protein [Polaromonas sp.]MDQ3270779.1 hypothetical protein [Pseudomonadota bacterium]